MEYFEIFYCIGSFSYAYQDLYTIDYIPQQFSFQKYSLLKHNLHSVKKYITITTDFFDNNNKIFIQNESQQFT